MTRRRPLPCRSLLIRSRQRFCRIRDSTEIRRVEIVFSGDTDQGEKRIPPRVGEGGSHSLRRGDIGDQANRPFRGDPLTRRMRKNGCKAKEPGFLVDFRGLDGCDLIAAKAFADNVQSARKRCITEGAVGLAGEGGPDGGSERFFWIGQLRLGFCKRAGNITDCITGAVHGWCPPCSGHQSSRRRILSVWPGSRARSPLWRPPVSGL